MANTENTDNGHGTGDIMSGWLIIFPILYLSVMILLAFFWSPIIKHLSYSIVHPFHQMPLSVIWFGALGGVIISLQGIFFNNQRWSKSYNYWYALSPVIGAIYGVFSYLFIVVILKSASSAQTIDSGSTLFALAAFTLGYAQDQVHSLIMGVFDLIFQPSTSHKKNK